MSKIHLFRALMLILLGLNPLQAKVWQTTQEWSPAWEKEYARWFESKSVYATMFTDKKSKYYGIVADCADASYALRAIFSLENGLPFKIYNPTGSSSKRYLDNESNYFDKEGDSAKRLVAMVNYLSDMVGTEHLSLHDTYPVKISSVNAGTLFTYKVKGADGVFIRHSYNIKSVTPVGEFDLIYSTQAAAKAKMPLSYRKSRQLSNAPLLPSWGFKRFKWPSYHDVSNASLPSLFNYSTEQYELAKKYNERDFFKHVTSVLRKENDTPDALVKRKLNSVCEEANERIAYVSDGYKHHLKLGGQCMNYADFDAFSTPSRDKALAGLFLDLKDAVDLVIKGGKENQVDFVLMQMSKAVVYGYEKNSQEDEDLKKYCSVNYKTGKSLHLAELYSRIKKGLLSSHPNDSVEARWGEPNASKTSCKKWY
jgi:hypothetical protein